MKKGRDPETREEWQEAVDAAHFLEVLDSARKYGLITGGPEANLERCEDILERGRQQGITPSKDAIERGIAEHLVPGRRKG